MINVRDPKPRLVSAAPFRDRVVHHALFAVIEPIFERGFIANTYANRAGMGTHRAIAAYERLSQSAHPCPARRHIPVLSGNRPRSPEGRLSSAHSVRPDPRGSWDTIVDGSNPQEAVNQYYSGDDLFSPFDRRRGLPIGNLTSQFFANLYLDCFDHFATEVLKASYVRYVDDFALFHDQRVVLEHWRTQIGRFLEGRRLRLHPQKTGIFPTSEPSTFLGFVLMPEGHRRLPGRERPAISQSSARACVIDGVPGRRTRRR